MKRELGVRTPSHLAQSDAVDAILHITAISTAPLRRLRPDALTSDGDEGEAEN